MESSKWSRDWRQFDWDEVIKKFDQAERTGALYREKNPDIGISAEEFLEYLDWLRECDSLLFWQLLMKRFMEENGVPKETVNEVLKDSGKRELLAAQIREMVEINYIMIKSIKLTIFTDLL